MAAKLKEFVILLMIAILYACNQNTTASPATTDEGIAEIVIGTQIWTALNYHPAAFGNPGTIGVNYDNNSEYGNTYGMLLTYDEALSACPEGWHLPSLAEWETLFDHLGGEETAGGKLKSDMYWQEPNLGDIGESGFDALPGGGASNTMIFDGLGWAAHFWTATADGSSIQVVIILNNSAEVSLVSIPPSMYASARYIKND